ncbi:MAG: hypothetical protein VKK59_00525 [Vampirovibrionales bacterium]|nr:hypothetical protein [Vampirovibrionales bacterium]
MTSWFVLAPTLLTGLAMGLTHSLEPGHGKLLVTTYLAAHRCRWFEVLALAGVVVLMNAASNGLIVLSGAGLLRLTHALDVESHRWVNLALGVVITLLGVVLTLQHWKNPYGHCAHAHDKQDPPEFPPCPERPPHWWELASIGVVSGLRPCPEGAIMALGLLANWGIWAALSFVMCLSVGSALMVVGLGLVITLGAGLLGLTAKRQARLQRSLRVASLWLSRLSFIALTLIGVWMMAQAMTGHGQSWLEETARGF